MTGPRTVLVAEDDALLLEVLVITFERAGYEVRTARTGPALLAAIDDSPPDILVTDLGLPIQDGAEVIRALRSAGHRFPVLVLSGSEMTTIDGSPTLRTLQKPVPRQLLLETVAQLLEPA